MVPELNSLGVVQGAARRDLHLTGKPKTAQGPINGAGAAGDAKKGKIKSIKCYNCDEKGHTARDYRLPKKERSKKWDGKKQEVAVPTSSKTPTESGLNLACATGIIEGDEPLDGTAQACEKPDR